MSEQPFIGGRPIKPGAPRAPIVDDRFRITSDQQLAIASQLDDVIRQLELHDIGSDAIRRVVRPLLESAPDGPSTLVRWHNASTDRLRDDLMLAIDLIVKLWSRKPIDAGKLAIIARRIRDYAAEPNAILRRGLDFWNQGDDSRSWADVAVEIGRTREDGNSTSVEIKRFADKNSLPIRLGKRGRKSNI